MSLEVERSKNFLYLRKDGIQIYRTLKRDDLQALAWDVGGDHELYQQPGNSYWILILGSTPNFADTGRAILAVYLREFPDEP